MASGSSSLKLETERLETFKTWPVSFMDPSAMAKAGFYYTKQEDIVTCAFCGLSLCNWKEGDSVVVDHRRESPKCPFLCKTAVSNVPLSGPSLKVNRSHLSNDSCGFSSLHVSPSSCRRQVAAAALAVADSAHLEALSLRTLGFFCVPKFPKYDSYEVRLASFKNWPSSAKQSPVSLSEAGFYYTGKADETVCFYCGGPLKDWEDKDDPWVQHAWWSPTCMYVFRMKGHEFVSDVCSKADPNSTTTETNTAGNIALASQVPNVK